MIALGRVEFQVSGDDPAIPKDRPVTVIELAFNLTHVTRLPVEKALQQLPTTIIDRPRVLKSLSEMEKMLVFPTPEQEMFGRALVLLNEVIPADRSAIF